MYRRHRKPEPFLMMAKDGMFRVYDIAGNWYPFTDRDQAQDFLNYLRETTAFNPLSAGFKTPMDKALDDLRAITELSVPHFA